LKRYGILGTFLLSLILSGAVCIAQSEVKDFPTGTTTMVYELKTEDVAAPETITLTVVGYGDGRYRLQMSMDAVGTADELGVFGFLFGMTQTATGGSSVSFDPLSALIENPQRLAAGDEYQLAGGATFTGTTMVTIATLPCLQGSYVNPKQPDVRITVALSLLRPVFISPYIREEELRDGQWVETFSLKLSEYTVSQAQG
jgi:hypothetical protein